jgi:two-component system, sensor histidine kinase and response regulator
MSTSVPGSYSPEAVAELRHKLRTPLNHVLGYSEMLLEDVEPNSAPRLREGLEAIREAGQELVRNLQSGLGTADGSLSLEDVDRFRREALPSIRRITQIVGNLVRFAPEPLAVDLLRIGSATAELLDFAINRPAGLKSQAQQFDSGAQIRRATEAKASILVVDDDDANRDILSRQLQKLGFTVESVATGEEALARIKEQPYSIALVDFMMPGMTGLEVLGAIKSDSPTRDVPVVMLSALDDLAGVSKSIEQGADDYIFKPFDPVLLSARISAALERSRLRAAERARTKELEHISQELSRSNSDLQRFAYAASHDLQSPLRTITTHLQLLERHIGESLSADDLELFHFATDAAMRMSQLIKDLLTYSQVSTEECVVTTVACDEVLESTLQDLCASIEESKAVIECGTLPTVKSDAVQLRQLFSNLIGNAIKYRGEQPPRVVVRAKHEDRAWRFSITDNGVGIPTEYLDEVFKLFRRLHGRERPGTGLGLAICKRILERLGGEIWVESEVGVGSTFHFTIPDEPPMSHRSSISIDSYLNPTPAV